MTRRRHLFPKYALLIITLVGSMLVASGAVVIYFSYRENQAHVVALQTEKAQGAATRIEQYVLNIEHQLGWTALPRVDVPGGDPREARRIEYLKLLRQVPAITDVAWIDGDGREQLRVSRLAMDELGSAADASADPGFRSAIEGKTWFGPVYFRRGTEPYMRLARPAGPGGGVTAAEVNLKFVWDVVSRIRIGAKGLAYVVDADGTLIAHPDISLVLKKSDMSALPQVAAQLRPGAGAEKEGARDLSGQRMLAAHTSIPSLGWTVFVESPRAEAFEPLYVMLRRMGLVLALALLVSMAATFFLARALVRPLRALQEGAAQIGAGDLDRRIEVHTGDELEGLADQFNRMAGQLRESYAQLERKVEQRTAELSESLAQQTATAEVLRVIGSSVADARPAFDAILDACQRFFAATGQGIALADDAGMLHNGGFRGAHEALLRAVIGFLPRPLEGSATGLAIRERRVVHYPDVLAAADAPAPLHALAAAAGDFSIAIAPMLWDQRGVGAVLVLRDPPSPFSAKELTLLKTFADQAVIAIQNARLFAEIEEKGRQLALANQHKSEFLANMSHELRTPLNAIIGFSEVLAERMFGELNDKQLDYLKDIHASGYHLLSLINDILDLSKIEAGRMELDLSSFDLPMLLDNTTTLVRERALQHGLALALEVDPALGDWVADARKLKQVVINLLSNAVKFTPAGGRVTLRARMLEEAVEIAVADTGVGIAADQQALVFEEFRQAGGHYLRKAEGTGLGLALAKRFVELHGGTIRLESAPGQGSTFAFVLPRLTLDAASRARD
ncbi:ATP-binding protein [Variovorax soli]|uniref:histidine kinase n=1 Tax=Variovorax soli TaxID=376815 RepID=A0ABU1NDA9_9BURK|nr:ATP-binding protein [Variovorax soli]MDR6536448.1 signal transduction histidine kinase [Variovorax soli]